MRDRTLRNVLGALYRALRVPATTHGRRTEAEVREILAAAVKPEGRLRVGDALAAIGRRIGMTDEDVAHIESLRDQMPSEPRRGD
jgi:plasmid stability protein